MSSPVNGSSTWNSLGDGAIGKPQYGQLYNKFVNSTGVSNVILCSARAIICHRIFPPTFWPKRASQRNCKIWTDPKKYKKGLQEMLPYLGLCVWPRGWRYWGHGGIGWVSCVAFLAWAKPLKYGENRSRAPKICEGNRLNCTGTVYRYGWVQF